MAGLTPVPALSLPGERRDLTVIGWMEKLCLPDLGLTRIKTKIDTGARTSALHATGIVRFSRDGARWVRFTTDTGQGGPVTIEAPVHGLRRIKNTSGIPEDRVVIRTRLQIAGRVWAMDLSLADRTNMTFPMIIGRAALKNHGFVVHTRRAFLVSQRLHPAQKGQ